MNKKSLKTLEFDKVKNILQGFASSDMAKKEIQSLEPFKDLDKINSKLLETSDAALLISMHGILRFNDFKDLNPILKRLAIGGNLSIIELLTISNQLSIVSKVKTYGNNAKQTLDSLDIATYFNTIDTIPNLYKEITKCILSEEEIADDASDKLYSIRKSIKNIHSKIRQQLNKIITSPSYQTMLQDPIITIKNDRFCVPVKAEYRGTFKGMIHEHSASGSTLFIEPISVVELNNSLRTYLSDETKEIERILAYLSAIANNYKDELESNQIILTKLDFIFAKGEFSVKYKCSKPLYNTDQYINLKKARHPLLEQNSVVPIDVELGNSFTTLVVTGPNTGGKTVSLKTIGLLSVMGQSGLHIPAFDGSSLTVLNEIFADIGDEQSIEQSLSTFSSHMTNIVEILKGATYNSLVLFDELGAGTDPTEGAALAMSILDNLFKKRILTVATTHYSELKVYALSTKGIENASQEFDITTLRPTYKLLVGIPGKSNAFAISKRLGLSDEIIEESKKLLASKEVRFEDLITDLEYNKKTAILEKEKAENFRQEAERFKQKLEEQKIKLDSQKEKILQKAKEDAYKIIKDAKNDADSIIREMNTTAKKGKGNQSELEKNRSKLRNSLSNLESSLTPEFVNENKVDPSKIVVGGTVYVISFDQKGTVLSLPNAKGDLQVQLGIMNTKVNLSNIKLVQESNPYKPKTQKSIKSSKSSQSRSKAMIINTEIDIRGTTSDEAIILIDKFLDDTYLAHLAQVTIIHGKGTGALRQAIHKHLRSVKYIKSYRLGNYGEGESGVTIVNFE